jgi:hypothetical protein
LLAYFDDAQTEEEIRWRALFGLMVFTGCRPSEARRARPDAITQADHVCLTPRRAQGMAGVSVAGVDAGTHRDTIGGGKSMADQPKNHRRIIANVAAIGTIKASTSPLNVSRSIRRRCLGIIIGTSMRRKSLHEADTRTTIGHGPDVGRGWMVRDMRRRSEATPTPLPRAVLFYTLPERLPALIQDPRTAN